MTFAFREARRDEAKPIIGIYALSGHGKTWSSLLLARGFAGPKGRVGMIDTEAGRGEAYADMIEGGYLVLPLRENFSPTRFGQAIAAAEKADLQALIIDSASHEWEGIGGVLSMAADNQAKGYKGQIVWQKPKIDHQMHFMGRLMQTSIPLVVVCMRAKYPLIEVRGQNGQKELVRGKDLEPKQADDILSEMYVSGWIDAEHRFHVVKFTRPDLAAVIRDGEPITLETGRRLRAWADAGAVAKPPTQEPQHAAPQSPQGQPPAEQARDPEAGASGASGGGNAGDQIVSVTVVEIVTPRGETWRFALPTQRDDMLQAWDAELEAHAAGRDAESLAALWAGNKTALKAIKSVDPAALKRMGDAKDRAKVAIEGERA